MPEFTNAQRRRVAGILAHVDEYLTLRFIHAERVNPKIGRFVEDLKSQLLATVHEILIKGKSWGTEKLMVADILCGDDLNRRYAVLNTTGQYSIMHEIITALDEHNRSSAAVRITNMKDLYAAIDASIGELIELSQTWVWWDLPDAVNLYAFHGQIKRIQNLVQMEITDQVQDYYRGLLGLVPGTEVSRDMMVGHEFRRMQRLITEFELHRRDDLPHMVVLKREVSDASSVDGMIRDLAHELDVLRQLEDSDEHDEEIIREYAQVMACDPTHVRRDHVVRYRRDQVQKRKEALLHALQTGQVLGPPHNHKQTQLEQMERERDAIMPLISADAREAAKLEEDNEAPVRSAALSDM